MERTLNEFAELLKRIEKSAQRLANELHKKGDIEGAKNQRTYAAYLGLISEMALSEDLDFLFSIYAD